MRSLSSGRFMHELWDWAGGGVGDQKKQGANVIELYWSRSRCNGVESEATLESGWLNLVIEIKRMHMYKYREKLVGEGCFASPHGRRWLANSPISCSTLANHLSTFPLHETIMMVTWSIGIAAGHATSQMQMTGGLLPSFHSSYRSLIEILFYRMQEQVRDRRRLISPTVSTFWLTSCSYHVITMWLKSLPGRHARLEKHRRYKFIDYKV